MRLAKLLYTVGAGVKHDVDLLRRLLGELIHPIGLQPVKA